MTVARAGLIDPDPPDPLQILRLDRPIDVVMHDPPDPRPPWVLQSLGLLGGGLPRPDAR